MFENYKQMTSDQKAEVKAIHKAVRVGCGDRYNNLIWGFVRGFPFRRIERSHRMEGDYEHNLPSAYLLAKMLTQHGLAKFIPGGVTEELLQAWIDDPSGAIPAPVRVRTPYVRAVEAVA